MKDVGDKVKDVGRKIRKKFDENQKKRAEGIAENYNPHTREAKEKVKSIDIISESNSWSSIKSDGKIPVWGLTKSRYWIKLALENKSQLKKWVLASNWPQKKAWMEGLKKA